MRRIATIVAALATILSVQTTKAAGEKATGQIRLLSSTGSGPGEVFNYGLTLDNTGTTNIGTLWYSWLPGLDFLDVKPTNITSPSGWTVSVQGFGPPGDGYSIQWIASPSTPLAENTSLSGFDFSSTQSLTAITSSLSVPLPFYPTGLSYVYIGGPETDSGNSFVASAAVPEPASAGLLMLPLLALTVRRPVRSLSMVHA